MGVGVGLPPCGGGGERGTKHGMGQTHMKKTKDSVGGSLPSGFCRNEGGKKQVFGINPGFGGEGSGWAPKNLWEEGAGNAPAVDKRKSKEADRRGFKEA